jgi:hypothetical protein
MKGLRVMFYPTFTGKEENPAFPIAAGYHRLQSGFSGIIDFGTITFNPQTQNITL